MPPSEKDGILPKLAIFDMDGTLIDTCMVNFYSYREALAESGYELTREYFEKECFGKGYKDYLPPIIGKDKDLLEKIHERKISLYDKYIGEARLNPVLYDFMGGMKGLYHMALVTTASKKNVYDMVEHFNLGCLLELILTSAEITKLKPDPEGFLMAMDHFKIPPERTVVFEDSDVGIEAAKRCGATVFRAVQIN